MVEDRNCIGNCQASSTEIRLINYVGRSDRTTCLGQVRGHDSCVGGDCTTGNRHVASLRIARQIIDRTTAYIGRAKNCSLHIDSASCTRKNQPIHNTTCQKRYGTTRQSHDR